MTPDIRIFVYFSDCFSRCCSFYHVVCTSTCAKYVMGAQICKPDAILIPHSFVGENVGQKGSFRNLTHSPPTYPVRKTVNEK